LRLGGSSQIWRRASAYREVAEKADACLETVGLLERAEISAKSLSHGEKRTLEIALLLAGDTDCTPGGSGEPSPRVMLLDEPMAGVASADVPALIEVIRRVVAEGGRSVLMVEHHMDVLLGLADRLAVMHHGALLACDTPEKVMADAEVQAAYLGEPL
jgi:branched-chain amino acid transport system ATP-binding protein